MAQQAMTSSLNYPINEIFRIDEFMISRPKEGKKGRSKGDKKLIVMLLKY